MTLGRRDRMAAQSYPVISADSHVIEPGDLFQKHLPAKLRDRAPVLISWEGGSAWKVEGSPPIPLPPSASTGSDYRMPEGGTPIKFADVLPLFYDPAQRVKAQDLESVDAEVLYPTPGLWDAIKR